MKSFLRVVSLGLLFCLLLGTVSFADAGQPYTDPWGYTDEDGDGLILVEVPGDVFTAYMLIVLDPTRVVLGTRPEKIFNRGYTVEEYAQYFDAVAAINAGGFEDPNGEGDGSTPDNAMVHEGEVICGFFGIGRGFVGLDADSILQIGFNSVGELTERNIQEGAGFGPALIRDGEIADPENLVLDNLNPRTALGQRSDGALLMLVIDGRQPNSIGATQLDAAMIMQDFGAVTASNLDGGNSTLLYYEGDYVNNAAGAVNIRNMPSSFVVLKEGKEQTETFLTRFAQPDTTVTHHYVVEESVTYEDKCPADLRETVETAALQYLNDFVFFSANVDWTGYAYYDKLYYEVDRESPLWARIKQGSATSGFTWTKAMNIVCAEVTECSLQADGTYVVQMAYTTETTGSRATVQESRQMRVFLEEKNGELLVEAMEFFRN